MSAPHYFNTILAAHGTARHTLLGAELHPYCLAHCGALEAAGSPLVTGRRPVPLHLAHAARICACGSWPDLAAAFDREPTEDEARELLRVANDPEAFSAALAGWDRYILQTAPPVPMFREKGGRPLASPPSLVIAVRSALAIKLDIREVWWIPLGELRLYVAVADELEGNGRPWTPEEIEVRDRLRARGLRGTARAAAPPPRAMSLRKAKDAYWRAHGRR